MSNPIQTSVETLSDIQDLSSSVIYEPGSTKVSHIFNVSTKDGQELKLWLTFSEEEIESLSIQFGNAATPDEQVNLKLSSKEHLNYVKDFFNLLM